MLKVCSLWRHGVKDIVRSLRSGVSPIALASAVLLAVGVLSATAVFNPAGAAEQIHNLDDASTVILTVGNSAKFGAVPAGTNELFTVANGVAVGDTGVIVSTTTANGVGTLQFLGASVATGAIGAANQSVGILEFNGAASAVSISGAVFATNVSFTAATTLTQGGDINTTAINFANGATGTVSMAADKKIVGAVTNATTNQGTLTFAATTANTTLVSGATGSTGAGLSAVNVAPATGITATFTGAYLATTTTHSGAGTVAFGSTVGGAVNISGGGLVTGAGAITGAVDNTGTAGTGTLTMAATKGVSGAVGTTNALASVVSDSTGGVTAFGGVVKATTISVGGTGNTTYGGDVTGAVNFTGAGTATVADTKKIVGAVTTSANNTGTLTFSTGTGAVTLASGNIGTSAAKLLAVNATSGNGITQTFGGDVNATTITLTGGNATSTFAIGGNVTGTTLVMAGAAVNTVTIAAGKSITAAVTQTVGASLGTLSYLGATTVSNSIGAAAAGQDLLAVNFAGSSSIGGDVYAKTVSLNGGAGVTHTMTASKLVGSNVATGSTALAASTTLDLGAYTMTARGTGASAFTSAAGSVIKLNIGGTQAATGQIDLTGAAGTYVNGGGTMTVTPTIVGTVIRNGDKIVLINAGAAPTVGTISVTGSGSITWTAAAATAVNDRFGSLMAITDLALTATVATPTAALALPSGAAVTTLNTYTGANTGVISLAVAVQSLTSAQTVDAAPQLVPVAVNGSSVQGAMTAVNQVFSVIGSRAENVRVMASADGTGVSTGETLKGLDTWVQGFGSGATQDKRDNINGYNSTTYGGAVGVDFRFIDPLRIGVAGSYARTGVNQKVLTGNGTDIDSYGGSLYANYTGEPWYLDGTLSYTRHDYDGTRVVNIPGFNARAKSDYSADQYSARADAGYPLQMGKMVFTPNVALAYSRLEQDGYTETGGGGANLAVDSVNFDSVRTTVGAKLAYAFNTGTSKIIPEIRAAWHHELADENTPQTTSAFTGGTKFNTVGMTQPRDAGQVGAGLKIISAANWDLDTKYDYDFKSDYDSHVGRIEAKVHF